MAIPLFIRSFRFSTSLQFLMAPQNEIRMDLKPADLRYTEAGDVMNKNSPIGVFDSGLGGISVVDEIRRQLPDERIVYFGDSAHNPYGTKTKEQITGYCTEICDRLISQDVKAIVIACNTATSACVPFLRKRYPIDIIGMEPALKVAADLGKKLKIAVWATELTLREEKFSRLMERFEDDESILKVACPKLVRLVEEDRLDDQNAVKSALNEYLEQSDHPDVIVLGCTHFIFYRDELEKLVPPGVRIVDGNEGTARHLKKLLADRNLLSDQAGEIRFDNSLPPKIEQSVRLFERISTKEKHREYERKERVADLYA